ncbi:MAG: carboxypeptidase-like regulatory domain-containing protein, partial [Candidatus Diapherotrites archaeon]|nr:carboxypeptidase-like regulatory domain-containing protein [Candidatus Diapherotrites archaeon]
YEPLQTTVRLLEGQLRSVPLSPKSNATFGNAKLIVKVFDKETSAALNDANVIIFNPLSKASYFEGYTVDGQYIADLPKGTVFAVAVSKAGFLRNVSQSATIRDDVTQQVVQLQKGGSALRATIVAKGGTVPLPNTIVSLYKFDGTLFDQQQAPFSGTVNFTGIDPDQNYLVSAYLTGYLPYATAFSSLETGELTIELEAEDATNTAKLGVYVTDAAGLAGNNASVDFKQIIDGVTVPTGLPTATTAYDGYVSVKVPVGYNILVSATQGLEAADANILVQSGENNIALRLKRIDSAKLLRVLGLDGNPVVNAWVLVTTQSGDGLFDDNISADGTALFDALTADIVNITVTLPDGNVFSSQENVKGKSEIIVRLKPNNESALAPPLQFMGLENADGSAANGLTPGKEYWARFELSWAEGDYRGGVHIRLGNDAEPFAESDDVGIVGFDAGGYSSFVLSRSYSPTPLPGNEALDLQNRTDAGAYAKWLEIYFDNPKGVQQFRVKIKAKETISKSSVFVHYRSWALIGAAYQRFPADAELGTESFSQSKTALYAATIPETLKLFSGSTTCAQDTCVTFSIVSQDGTVSDKTDFTTAGRGRVFALEAVIRSQKAVGALLKATTPKQQPKLFFTGSEVESFTQFIDNNATQTAMEINDLSILENVERRARIYFKPVQNGPATIHVEFLAEGTVVKDDFFFNVVDERSLLVAIDPPIVDVGQPFRVIVKDDSNKSVSNATVHIRDNLNAIVQTVVGSVRGTGNGGEYLFSGSIGGGEFSAEVTAPGFLPRTVPFTVSARDVLVLPDEISVKMRMGIPTAQYSVDLENRSGSLVRDIGVEIVPDSDWPTALTANAGTVSSLMPNKKAKLDISAAYSGDQNARYQGTARIIVRGYVVGKYPAVAQSRLTVSYNQPLDSNCLEFSPNNLTVYLAANGPSAGVDTAFSPNQYYSNYGNYNATSPTYFGNASPTNQQYYQS